MTENDLTYTQKRVITSAFIDSAVKLGIAQAVLMVQDNLTECFYKMHCDGVYFKECSGFLQNQSFSFLNDQTGAKLSKLQLSLFRMQE